VSRQMLVGLSIYASDDENDDDDDDDDDWDEFLFKNINPCLNLLMYCYSLMLLFQYSRVTLNFSPISSRSLGLRSLLWYFLSLWSQRGSTSLASSVR